ncbi:MAG: type 1 glutamine amidotransferase domain-containing protein [Bacteroidota bacterium]
MIKTIQRSLFCVLAFSLIVSCKKEDSEKTTDPVIETPVQSTNKILMVVTSNNQLKDGSPAGYFLPEAIDLYKALKAAGYQITFASPAGGKAPMYERTTYVNMNRQYLDTSGLLNGLDSTVTLASIKVTDYKAVCYVGGFACLFDFPNNPDVKRITAGIYESGGIVAAVCHAPAALLNVILSNGKSFIENKKLTGRTIAEETNNGQLTKEDVLYYFPFLLEDELKIKKAMYSSTGVGKPFVVVDERLVTGQNPESTVKVAEAVVSLMRK